jgi:hypothetical protein
MRVNPTPRAQPVTHAGAAASIGTDPRAGHHPGDTEHHSSGERATVEQGSAPPVILTSRPLVALYRARARRRAARSAHGRGARPSPAALALAVALCTAVAVAFLILLLLGLLAALTLLSPHEPSAPPETTTAPTAIEASPTSSMASPAHLDHAPPDRLRAVDTRPASVGDRAATTSLTARRVLALVQSVDELIDNVQQWLVGIMAALATLFLMIGGVRYLMANGKPGEIEEAKSAFRSAGIGYVLALLAPLVVEILKSIVGA